MDLRARLAATPKFQELEPAELDALAAAMETVEAEDGEVLVREGERSDGCYLIVEGRVRVSHGEGEDAKVLQDLEPGDLFGILSLIDDGARSATCTAIGATTLAWMPAGAFTMLHEGSPALVLHFQKLVARQLAHDARALNESLVQAMLSSKDGSEPAGDSLSGELFLSSGD